MDLQLDCLPCILRQVVDASRMATADTATHQKIMDQALTVLNGYKEYKNAPVLTRAALQVVERNTGVLDPFADVKKADIEDSKKLLPWVKEFLDASDDKLYWALKIAATGNVIDRAITQAANGVESLIEKEIKRKFRVDHTGVFREKIKTAKTILIVGDNAGESVFDRILIEYLPEKQFSYAVRSAPTLNDVTMEDAKASGLGGCAKLISSGCDSPGLLLEESSKEFQDAFWGADIVISKGQGNFELLWGSGREIFFILKAKCPAIACALGVNLNDYIFKFQHLN